VRPRAAGHAVGGVARSEPVLGTTMGISLGALAGLPPSPLFVSEVLIVAGGFEAGRGWPAGIAALLLALGFLGLAHALIEGVAGGEHQRRWQRGRTVRTTTRVTIVVGVGLVALSAAAFLLPDSTLVHSLMAGVA
jgi:hydrogenase-4 component F